MFSFNFFISLVRVFSSDPKKSHREAGSKPDASSVSQGPSEGMGVGGGGAALKTFHFTQRRTHEWWGEFSFPYGLRLTIFETLWRSNYFPSPICPAVKKRLGDSMKSKPFCKYFTFFFHGTVQLRGAFSIDLGKCWRKRVEKYSFPTKHRKNAQPSVSFSFSFGIEANVFNSLAFDLATFSSAVQLYCLWVLTHTQSTQTTEDLHTGTDASFFCSFIHSLDLSFIP